MHISELDTPALLVDLDRLEENLRRVAGYCSEHGLRLRPHTKTHKSPLIGRMQISHGAAGLTVAKVGEAEVMLSSGTPDLLVAYPIVGESKLRRLMEVAKKTNVSVALDSLEVAQGLSGAAQAAGLTIGVLVEVNLGLNRCGLDPGPDLVALAAAITRLPGLRFDGVQSYYGHIWLNKPDGPAHFEKVKQGIAQLQEDFRKAGIELKIIGGGSTPTLFHSHEIAGINEIRPGTYVFYDSMQVAAGSCRWEDCAVTVLTTVVSAARPGYALIDGGSKTFTSDGLPGAAQPSYGKVTEVPEAVFYNMNEEHGYLDLREAGKAVRVGDRLRIIPNHVCVAVNMHEKAYGIRGDKVEEVWQVEARGKLQ
jgi:D-serine deaminase-like pyridoxal phosphate-dependent protein